MNDTIIVLNTDANDTSYKLCAISIRIKVIDPVCFYLQVVYDHYYYYYYIRYFGQLVLVVIININIIMIVKSR